MLKLELVPAAGDKLVLKLSPPPPPLADKQACACAHVTMRSHLQDVSSGLLADTGVAGGQHDRQRCRRRGRRQGEPGPLKDGIDAGGGNVAGELSPMKSFAKVGIVPADDGRITIVISESVSPSLLGAKVRVRSPGSLSSLSRL